MVLRSSSGAFAASQRALSRWPASKISSSGRTPAASCARANSSISGAGFSNTPRPKLTVPQVRLAISGSAASDPSRSSADMPIAPPVDTWTIMPGARSRIAATVAM